MLSYPALNPRADLGLPRPLASDWVWLEHQQETNSRKQSEIKFASLWFPLHPLAGCSLKAKAVALTVVPLHPALSSLQVASWLPYLAPSGQGVVMVILLSLALGSACPMWCHYRLSTTLARILLLNSLNFPNVSRSCLFCCDPDEYRCVIMSP